MSTERPKLSQAGLQPAGALMAKVMAPIAAKRGFAGADILAAWPELVGERYRDCTRPDSLTFPRDKKGDGKGVLTVRVDGGKAIYLQHELGVLIDRINAFVGFAAVGSIRLLQMPANLPPVKPSRPNRPVSAQERHALERSLEGIDNEGLKGALARLGEEVLAEKSPKSEP